MKKILVIGGNGYVGSRLRQVINKQYTVASVDACWYTFDQSSMRTDYNNLSAEFLSDYNVIILLAAHSSVKSAAGNINGPWLNNVTNFTELIKKLNKDQLLIYAGSASVYGDSLPGTAHTEHLQTFTPLNNYDITKYALDVHAKDAISKGHSIVGLRFGTINGWSPNLRTDVMINAMYDSAMRHNQITVMNKHIGRAILGIDDLCSAVCTIIKCPYSGIYNLASFNTTVDKISKEVATALSVPIIDNGMVANAYDFALNCSLFSDVYQFEFQDTPKSIVDSLVKNYYISKLSKRDNYIIYQWENNDRNR